MVVAVFLFAFFVLFCFLGVFNNCRSVSDCSSAISVLI